MARENEALTFFDKRIHSGHNNNNTRFGNQTKNSKVSKEEWYKSAFPWHKHHCA
jgi:hypothetical protein